jgi:hypothetical protein
MSNRIMKETNKYEAGQSMENYTNKFDIPNFYLILFSNY